MLFKILVQLVLITVIALAAGGIINWNTTSGLFDISRLFTGKNPLSVPELSALDNHLTGGKKSLENLLDKLPGNCCLKYKIDRAALVTADPLLDALSRTAGLLIIQADHSVRRQYYSMRRDLESVPNQARQGESE